MNNIKVATQIANLKVLILAEAAKEYEATWLKDAKKVLRDGTGRFAKKGNSTESDPLPKEDSAQMDAKSISKSLRSSSFRQEAGLSPGAAMDTVINNIYGAKKDDSSFMDKFNELHDEIADELSKFFGKDNPELGKSIKKGGIPLPKNDSLDNFLEFAITRYKTCVDKLKKVTEKPEAPQEKEKPGVPKEKEIPVEEQKLLGETVNSAIPVAISVAIATLPSTLLPALAEGKFNWKTILISGVIGQAANFAAQEGLDAAGIDDPVIRNAASLVAGILSGGIIGGGAKLKATKQAEELTRLAREAALKESNRVAKEVAEKKATEEAAKLAKEAAEKKVKILDGFPEILNRLEEIKQLGGSTGAVLLRDIDTGKLYVKKTGENLGHIVNEFTANAAYKILGVPVPKAQLYQTGSGTFQLTEYIEGKSLSEFSGDKLEAARKEIKKNFVADALLGNWDVVGAQRDNIIIVGSGKAYRIDNGGALEYRAQGGKKYSDWSDKVEEIYTLRNGKQNSQSAGIFHDISNKEIIEQIDHIISKKDVLVKSLQGELKKTIAKRIDYLSSLKETLKEAELAAEKKAAESAKLAKEATEKKAAKSIINSPETHNAQEVIDKLYDDSLNGDERKAIYEKLRSKRKPGVDDSRYLLKGEANSLNQGECLQAISRYTDMGYEKVNAYLREGADGIPEEFIAETRKEIELIYSGISRLPRYNPVEPYLSRYIRLVDPQKPIKKMDKASVQELLEKAYPDGGEITEPSFLSVSPSMEGTASFSDKSASSHSVKFVIRARESSVARDITQYNISGELEVLYPPGMRFKVVKKYIHSFDQAIHSPLEKVERLEKDYKIPRFNDLWVVELEEI